MNKLIITTALILLAQTATAKDIATVKSVDSFTWEITGTCSSHCDTKTATTTQGDASAFTWETSGECTAKCDKPKAEVTSATMK